MEDKKQPEDAADMTYTENIRRRLPPDETFADLADLFKRSRSSVFQTESQSEYLFFSRCKRPQYFYQLFSEHCL